MFGSVANVVDNTCDLNCQYDWLAISSNFFNVSIYTPALVIGLIAFVVYRYAKKLRIKNSKK